MATNTLSAASIKVQETTPWGALQDVTEVDFGTVNVNSTTLSDEYRIYLEDIDIDQVKAANSSDGTFGIQINSEPQSDSNENTYYTAVFTVSTANNEGDFSGIVSLAGEGAETLEIGAKATVKNLNCETLAEFREMEATLGYWDYAYYVGDGHVQYMYGNRIWVSDATGSIVFEAGNGLITDDIKPGIRVTFSAFPGTMKNVNSAIYRGRTLQAVKDDDNWVYPERKNVTTALTDEDYGKYVSIRNVKYDREEVQTPMFGPREDDTNPRWQWFKDAEGNEYTVECVAFSKYNEGISEDLKTEDLEIIGAVIGSSTSGGAPEPMIVPQWIRPVTPVKMIPQGEYTNLAESIIYQCQEEYKTTVSRDAQNPYLYKFSHLCNGNNGRAADVWGELTPECDKLEIMTGQPLERAGEEESAADVFLATAEEFDRTGNHPEQEPSPKGSIITFVYDDIDSQLQTLTSDEIISYTVYAYEFSDPDSEWWAMRWSHYGIWSGMQLVWRDPASVGSITDNDVQEVARYSIYGTEIKTAVPGINIIKYSDGSIRKVVER